jgi:hypothetical protein
MFNPIVFLFQTLATCMLSSAIQTSPVSTPSSLLSPKVLDYRNERNCIPVPLAPNGKAALFPQSQSARPTVEQGIGAPTYFPIPAHNDNANGPTREACYGHQGGFANNRNHDAWARAGATWMDTEKSSG